MLEKINDLVESNNNTRLEWNEYFMSISSVIS